MKLIRINELAEKLSMSKSSIRRLVRMKEFPQPIIIGDRIHAWNSETIDEWLKGKEGSLGVECHLPPDQS